MAGRWLGDTPGCPDKPFRETRPAVFPVSDNPNARAGSDPDGVASPPGKDSSELRRAGEMLLQRVRAGAVPTDRNAEYAQLGVAKLLLAIAFALDSGQALPYEVVRHAADIARHLLDYPAAPG